MPSSSPSALQPIDPASIPDPEQENNAPWIVRKLVGSMTGRIVMSSYESLRAAGTSVICLSPWGDSSPLFLPCIRFRDLLVHTVIAATGGTAAIAAPALGPIFDTVVNAVGDSIIVELGVVAGFDIGTKVANDLLIEHTLKSVIPVHSSRLCTTSVKTLLITLKFKHTVSDAALGFFRSSVHDGDPSTSLFSSIQDYLSVDKGWFSPYLFASGRRPIIPRNMKPDVVFCHAPFLQGDYRIAQTLLEESASIISLCDAPLLPSIPVTSSTSPAVEVEETFLQKSHNTLSAWAHKAVPSRSPSPQPEGRIVTDPAQPPNPPPLRRLVILVLGISPHRSLWTTSARPGESVINYHLLNGCSAVVIPVKPGCPLIAWDTLTLDELQKLESVEGPKFDGVVKVLFEYVSLCVDWDRVILPQPEGSTETGEVDENTAKKFLHEAIALVVAGGVRSKESKEVKKSLDNERAGIVMLRMP